MQNQVHFRVRTLTVITPSRHVSLGAKRLPRPSLSPNLTWTTMQPEPGARKARKTPEEIALIQEQRRAKKNQPLPPPAAPSSTLLERPWLVIKSEHPAKPVAEVKVLTWNLLAQCLVRRELFPTSDCLKAGDREPLIHNEIKRLGADVLCLQEVDRMDKLGPMLEKAGYSYRYACGPRKKHGCLIAFKTSMFMFEDEQTVFYDDEDVRTDGASEAGRRGKTFLTRNIGLVLSIRSKHVPSWGMIVATTHLFWHPRYTYERIRQAGILSREVKRLHQVDIARKQWPCIMAGDFNFPPDDPGYALLTRSPLLPEQKELIPPSYVVHKSVDPNATQQPISSGDAEEGGEGEAVNTSRVITNARPAEAADGLLQLEELASFYDPTARWSSAYDTGLKSYFSSMKADGSLPPMYGLNKTTTPDRLGYYEPQYTSYTHYWKSVLDYIFVLDTDDAPERMQVSGLLSPLGEEALDPSLPKLGVCGSDHLPLMTQLSFSRIKP